MGPENEWIDTWVCSNHILRSLNNATVESSNGWDACHYGVCLSTVSALLANKSNKLCVNMCMQNNLIHVSQGLAVHATETGVVSCEFQFMVQLSSLLTQYEPDVYDVGGASSAAQVLLTVLTERKLLYYGW